MSPDVDRGDLEQQLRDAFEEDAQRAHLFHPDGPPSVVAPPPKADGYFRRAPRRLVAIAAVLALLALVGVVALQDDDQSLDTSPVDGPGASAPRTIVSGGGCPYGIAGDPIEMQDVPLGTRFEARAGQSVAYTRIGGHVVIVSVPALGRAGDARWQDEAIELERGPATLWLDGPRGTSVIGDTSPFVQVRYVPETQAPCSSFTVTVESGTFGEAVDGATVDGSQDEQAELAIDVAERILLPGELDGLEGLALEDTQWTFVDTSDGPVSSDMAFDGATVSWDTGCDRKAAGWELDPTGGFLILTNVHTMSGTCGPPTTFGMTPHYPVIDAVLHVGRIPISLDDGRLYLGEPDGDHIVLAPPSAMEAGDEPDPLALPEPGEQPADIGSADEAVRNAYLTIGDTSLPAEDRAQFSERPAVWLAAAHQVTQGQYWDIIQTIQEQVDEVVFVSPTEAVLRFQLITRDSIVPRDHVGGAVLVDGRWRMAIETSCQLFNLAGVTCDMSL